MDFQLVLAAGVGTGTILLFAAIGEIFAERSGVLNLGVEGMMLIGAVAGFSTVVATGNPWLALVVAMLAGGVLSLLHGVFAIHLRADQVVSGLALTFLGTGLARVLGEGLSGAGATSQLPRLTVPVLSEVPLLGPIFLTNQSVLVYVGYALVPLAWFWIEKTRPGTPPARGRPEPERCRRPGDQRVRIALRLRAPRRTAGRPRRARPSRWPSSPAGSPTRRSGVAAGSPWGS